MERPLSDFGKKLDKLQSFCKPCDAAKAAKYRKENREKVLQGLKSSYQKNRKAHLEKKKEYQRVNQAAISFRRQLQRQKHKDAIRLRNAKRRARERGAKGEISKEDWGSIVAAQFGRCFYCGAAGKLTLDHVQAISQGGQHAVWYSVGACTFCNSSKGAKDVRKWAASPITQAKLVYLKEPCARSFWNDLNAHLLNGYVHSTPTMFIMGRPVRHNAPRKELVNPWFVFPREEWDAWMVYLAAGNLAEFWRVEPFP
jgi:5-methylcytosine-specific restriction endonuclease McrA